MPCVDRQECDESTLHEIKFFFYLLSIYFFRLLILATALTALPFLPAANIFYPVGFVIAERVLYIPSAGYCFVIAIALNKILLKRHDKYKVHTMFEALKFNVVYILAEFEIGTVNLSKLRLPLTPYTHYLCYTLSPGKRDLRNH